MNSKNQLSDRMSSTSHVISGFVILLLITGCGVAPKRVAPTISHVHIGHAITAWPATEKNQGLLVAAELSSVAALTNGQLLLESANKGDFSQAKEHLRSVSLAVDPEVIDPEFNNGYGLRRAAAESITHLKLAADVEDASANVQRTVVKTVIQAKKILDKTDELSAFLEAANNTSDLSELQIIAEEILALLEQIAGAPDDPNSYGLFNLREDVESMVDREDPVYRTVDVYFLFNLVRLPNGEWQFASRRSRGAAGAGY